MLIQWNEKLSVGNDMLDDEHKTFIKKINDIYNACEEDRGHEKVKETIEFFEEYVKKHFRDEEEFMVQIKFPLLDNHKKEHRKFESEIDGMRKRFEKDDNGELAIEIAEFGAKWLFEHIELEDQKYHRFLETGKI